jgi:hypothetical protein
MGGIDVEGLPDAGTPFEDAVAFSQAKETVEDVMLGRKMMDESGDPLVGAQ